ncbi:hypothetical protein F511_47081 [Dorcoceras hygrometricum]|uniref:Uncharacterized protein n=1 Tax=Dorcoceras hygrometricum TaxID=472368 RepID=A0A2Z6ZYK4_9LAMI|nr:hypothetical protein F511_47081 [Dorcoceras hygrometricum]
MVDACWRCRATMAGRSMLLDCALDGARRRHERRSCSGPACALAAHVMFAPPCVFRWWPPAGRRSGESPTMS